MSNDVANKDNAKETSTNDIDANIPDWVNANTFEDLVKANVPNYGSIKSFKALPAVLSGDNYATIMLRIEMTLGLKSGDEENISYMLKLPHQSDMYKDMLEKHNIFDLENRMYTEWVKEFEEMYREVGEEVHFSAQTYKLNKAADNNYVLLENLCLRGFKNVNRLECLDMKHIECVLKKLAQWHAASAVRVERKGDYPAQLLTSFFKEEFRAMMEQMNVCASKIFLDCIKKYDNQHIYVDDVRHLQNNLIDMQIKAAKVNTEEFNVLNHGDCWSNNVMFQYDDAGDIANTYFVDYQIPKYGTPAQDLLYFLLSSTKYELKISQFDYFIKTYYDSLIESLNVLKYTKKMPTLKDIHVQLIKYGIWGYTTLSGVMAVILLDPTDDASFDNIISDSETGSNFKKAMYTNPRFRKHAELVLPWLQNRGGLEHS